MDTNVGVQVRMRSRTDALPGVLRRSGWNIVEGKKGGRISRFRPGGEGGLLP